MNFHQHYMGTCGRTSIIVQLSGDGGLYAELLQNRAFQGVIPGTQNALNAWRSYNGAFLSVTSKTDGVSSALPNSLQVRIPTVVTGPIGFENTGYWGIKVQQGWTYKGSFYAKSDSFNGEISVSLKSKQGTIFATSTVLGVSKDWKQFTFEFEPTASAANDDNVFSVNGNGNDAAGKTIYFGMFSLFPPTFKGRGKWVQALTLVGSGTRQLESYPNTDGLGLLEYLNWAEDLEAVRIVFVIHQQDLQPYIDDALNEIEFIVGDAQTTTGGKLRASLGRTEPYSLKMIEVGSEDQFQPDSYAAYRWKAFVDAISAKYPQMEFIATTLPSTALDPGYQKIDFHQYNSPSWFLTNAFMFDDYPRNGTQYFIGEYAVTSTNDTNTLGDLPSGRLAYPTLEGAIAKAIFMTSLERNSDVVFAAAYAPSFQHIKNYQWTPDIIRYDASRLVKSISYYVQEMFSVNRGTHVLNTVPVSTADSAPLYWVASYNNQTNTVFLKVSNTGADDLVANIFMDFSTAGFATATSISSPSLSPISGLYNVSNTLDEPDLIIPVASSFAFPYSNMFNYTFPATSVTVISLQTTPL
ncbi:hypothetical protein H0H92_001716 [Tricholoma furcatifolium]|nr:hypothetical protein H0H92_001716 [Tricholoma furcatifolium]